MKRFFSIIIVGIMFLTFGTAAYAEAMPFALGSAKRESILMISGDTAICTSNADRWRSAAASGSTNKADYAYYYYK